MEMYLYYKNYITSAAVRRFAKTLFASPILWYTNGDKNLCHLMTRKLVSPTVSHSLRTEHRTVFNYLLRWWKQIYVAVAVYGCLLYTSTAVQQIA